MDVSLIIRVAGVGLLIAATTQILSRAGRDEIAMLVSITGTVLILIMVAEKIGDLFSTIKELFGI